MTLEIMIKAEEINEFKHLEELEAVMTLYSPIQYRHPDALLDGINYLVDIIGQHPSVQKEILLETMKHVKRNLGVITSFKYTLKQINSLTVAISHVNILMEIAEIQEKVEEYYAES
ncbi:hypothetical protein [Halobacillus litoralis]|uniref:hypothetical protein n=1 Tax=Halobacillus litoralis TaxID=45668 RepID=UPI00248FD5E0|nr:hypothetical protein [Halobacillus litoralis]